MAQIENKGIPCVMETWNTSDIIGLTVEAFLRGGVPEARQVFTPPDPAAMSCTAYIPDFIDALTSPLTDKEKWTGTYEPPMPPRIALTGTYDEIQSYFEGDLTKFDPSFAPIGWLTDGMPVVPPTEDRVAKMLQGTSHSPDEIIEFKDRRTKEVTMLGTVEKVAVNAVMAGCKPEYFPVVLAIAESGGCLSYTSDSSGGYMYVVSGPIAKEIGMKSDISYLCPGNPANMTIGRAATLIGINLAGTVIGITSIGRQGNHIWGLAFAEATDRSPWEGLNVDAGFGSDESVLIYWGGCNWITPYNAGEPLIVLNLDELQVGDPEHLIAALMNHKRNNSAGLIFFTPDTAKQWYDRFGFETMQQLQDFFYEKCSWTIAEAISDYWSYRGDRVASDLPPDTMVSIFRSTESIKIIVAGGDGPGWGYGGGGNPKSILIDKWR